MFEQDENMLRFGVTPVENLFIQDYLPSARGDYVKVYLYVLYCGAHPRKELSTAEIAQELGLSQSDTEAALRYWERRHLLVRLSDNPPSYRLQSATQLLVSGESGLEADSAFVAFSEDIYALFGDRRKVRPGEIAQAYEWVQDLGLRQETVLMLLSHCLSTRGAQFSFKQAEPEAVRMREANVVTAEDAEAFFAHSKKEQDGAKAVLRRLGKRRQPSQDELDLYRKWTQEWHYEPAAILEACAETTKGEPTFAYLDGILNGIRTRAEQGNAPRTAQQLRSQLTADQEKRASVRGFAAELGLKGAPDTLNATYTRLCGEYEPGLVLLAAHQAHAAGRGLDAVEPYLQALRKRGLTTREQALTFIAETNEANRALYAVFSACGLGGKPTNADRALYKKWRSWGFENELLLLAAEQSRGADNKLPYMDKVLEAWHEAGVTAPEQVSARQAEHARGRNAGGSAQRSVKQVSAQQYTQREYTDEELNSQTLELLKEASQLDEQ
jgi:DNA replication protein DnaD